MFRISLFVTRLSLFISHVKQTNQDPNSAKVPWTEAPKRSVDRIGGRGTHELGYEQNCVLFSLDSN